MPRYRLLQARMPDDPVREEERLAFASRMEVPLGDIELYDLIAGGSTVDRVCADVDAVLVGGSGAFSVLDPHDWIRDFIDTLGGLADRGFPTFASCFGFQGLVVALGGTVMHDEANAEVGTYALELLPGAAADPLFGRLPQSFVAQEGHKDRASVMPASVHAIAASARCPFQALSIPGKPVFATQFHPELTHSDNQFRFRRYFDMYAYAFGEIEALRKLEADFHPSPEANDLLRAFARMIEERDRA